MPYYQVAHKSSFQFYGLIKRKKGANPGEEGNVCFVHLLDYNNETIYYKLKNIMSDNIKIINIISE